MHDLVPFVQSKKCEKHPWRSITLLKVATLCGCFSYFLNCTNGIKLRKASRIYICRLVKKYEHSLEYGEIARILFYEIFLKSFAVLILCVKTLDTFNYSE